MLMLIKEVLPAPELASLLAALPADGFLDGKRTAGNQARAVKNNLQIPADDPRGKPAATLLNAGFAANQIFLAAARPARIFPPLFARYDQGMSYGDHLDNPIIFGTKPLRTDLSVTVFLNNASDYEGGELVLQTEYGTQNIKGNAGDAVIYPASFIHRVEPIKSGTRLVACTWIQSSIRDHAQRRVLFDLFTTARQLHEQLGAENAAAQTLTRTHNNLVRMWAEV